MNVVIGVPVSYAQANGIPDSQSHHRHPDSIYDLGAAVRESTSSSQPPTPRPPPPRNPSDHDSTPSTCRQKVGGYCICLILAGLASVAIIVCLGFYRAHNRAPVIKVDSLSSSIFDVWDSDITAVWNITFSLTSHSIDQLDLDFRASVLYKNHVLCHSLVLPRFLLNESYALVSAIVLAQEIYVGRETANAILTDVEDDGAVGFGVELFAEYKQNEWDANYSCGEVSVGFSSSNHSGIRIGSMLGGPIACRQVSGWSDIS